MMTTQTKDQRYRSLRCNRSAPPLKRGIEGIYLSKSPLTPLFLRGELNAYTTVIHTNDFTGNRNTRNYVTIKELGIPSKQRPELNLQSAGNFARLQVPALVFIHRSVQNMMSAGIGITMRTPASQPYFIDTLAARTISIINSSLYSIQ